MQINLKISDKLFFTAKKHATSYGFENIQEFIRELLREKLFEKEVYNGFHTYTASEQTLARNWLKKEEDEAWQHLQKET